MAEISSVNKIFFRNSLSPTLNFGLVYFMNDLLYKIDKKSLFFTSLGVFPIDRFLRQFRNSFNNFEQVNLKN